MLLSRAIAYTYLLYALMIVFPVVEYSELGNYADVIRNFYGPTIERGVRRIHTVRALGYAAHRCMLLCRDGDVIGAHGTEFGGTNLLSPL